MERKFKVGDRVKDKSTGLSCDVVYVHEDSDLPYLIVSKTTGGVCINWRRSEQIELIPLQKFPEPKYNVGDKVKARIEGLEPFDLKIDSWCIAGNRYFYTLESQGYKIAGAYSVEETEPNYKKGDKVWNKRDKTIDFFHRYNSYNYKACLLRKAISMQLSDIEPYTGQDKPKEETVSYKYTGSILNEEDAKRYFDEEAIKWANGTSKPTHPYTAILKSGVKVGVSQGIAIAMIACMDSESCKRINNSEYFLHSEIAAIVPTENIVK